MKIRELEHLPRYCEIMDVAAGYVTDNDTLSDQRDLLLDKAAEIAAELLDLLDCHEDFMEQLLHKYPLKLDVTREELR